MNSRFLILLMLTALPVFGCSDTVTDPAAEDMDLDSSDVGVDDLSGLPDFDADQPDATAHVDMEGADTDMDDTVADMDDTDTDMDDTDMGVDVDDTDMGDSDMGDSDMDDSDMDDADMDTDPPPYDTTGWTMKTNTITDSASSGTPDSYFYQVDSGSPLSASISGGGSGVWSVNVFGGFSNHLYCTGSPLCQVMLRPEDTTVVVTAITTGIGSYALTIQFSGTGRQ